MLLASGCGTDGDTKPATDAAIADSTTRADAAPARDTSSTGDSAVDNDAAPPPKQDAAPTPDKGVTADKGITPDTQKPDTAPPCNSALEGAYSASFSLEAVEKVGSIVVNKMACSGTLSATHACSQQPVLQGTYTCVYPKGLTLFDKNQSGTISATIAADGTLSGTIKHAYASSLTRSYKVTGSVAAGGAITGSGSGSLLPNPQSAVPWKVTFSF
ncbi:MAG: hypothetical protein KC503_30860 [Myxococcales bacterium]|nr:hypothetical protein [Myxococcales bacterium]